MARAADALTRPAMPAAPTEAPAPARATRRITVDLTLEDHRRLRLWALDADTDATALVRALLDLAATSPRTRLEAEDRARRGAA